MESLLPVLITILVISITSLLLIEGYKYYFKLRNISQLLQSAAWNLVREMENNPTFTAKNYRNSLKRDYEEIFVDNLKQIQPHPQLVALGKIPKPVTKLPGALETIEKNKQHTKDFWFVAQGLRNGLQVFIALFILDNPRGAYIKMIEHMKRQRDEFREKGTTNSLNFTELKMVLGLPTEWPKGELPEQLDRKQFSIVETWFIRKAIEHHRKEIFRGLTYKPYTFDGGDDGPEYFGEDVLVGMRGYIR